MLYSEWEFIAVKVHRLISSILLVFLLFVSHTNQDYIACITAAIVFYFAGLLLIRVNYKYIFIDKDTKNDSAQGND